VPILASDPQNLSYGKILCGIEMFKEQMEIYPNFWPLYNA